MAKHQSMAGLQNRKSPRRKLINISRIFKYGVDNFIRNAWLSLAATVIMTMTLSIILVSIIASSVLSSTINNVRDKVEMSIYVANTISIEDVAKIKSDLRKLSTVEEVSYVSAQDAKTIVARDNQENIGITEALNEAKNVFPGTYHIKVKDIDNTLELEKFVAQNKTYLSNKAKTEPSFQSSRREALNSISRTAKFIERFGLLAVVIFIVIAMLVIFNTIRMAIFNRKDEIYMMRLIGADPSFIRGPFMIEAMMNGLIAGIVSTLGIYFGVELVKDKLLNYGVDVEGSFKFVRDKWYLILLFTVGVGMLIGLVSALLATRRHLRDKEYDD